MLRAVMAGMLGFLWGVSASQHVSQRAKMLRKWCAAIASLRANCVCLRLSPEELWQLSAEETGLPKAIEKAESDMALLTKEEKTQLKACLRTLLDGTQEQQERQFDYARAFLEKRLTQAEEKQRQDAKLYVTLGVFGGLILFLVCV